MVRIDNEKCISCIACISACPYDLIKMEGLFIEVENSQQCNDCDEKSCKILCPTGAIFLD